MSDMRCCDVDGCDGCDGCATHLDVHAASIIAIGFHWTLDEAHAAGWEDEMDMCDSCYGELPR